MWQQKIIYYGNSHGLFNYDTFLAFMKGKGLRIPYESDALNKTEIYVVEPATTLIYRASKRLVPRDFDLWHVTVTLSGYGVEEVENNLAALISEYAY